MGGKTAQDIFEAVYYTVTRAEPGFRYIHVYKTAKRVSCAAEKPYVNLFQLANEKFKFSRAT